MNKYKVTRHCERNGYENTIDSVVFSTSEERAISIVRYTSTRSDKLPNGELTNYTTDDGTHVWWTAEQVEIDHPETAPAPELDDVPEVEKIVKKSEGDKSQVHVIATGKNADKFNEIKTELGLKKNTDVFAKILDGYGKAPTDGVFVLPDDIAKTAKSYASFLNVPVENIYYKAVKSYLHNLSTMSLGELVRRKEAQHDNA